MRQAIKSLTDPIALQRQGFTLPEQLIVLILTGVLAAIAIPSFFNWFNNKKVDDALAQLEGALKEAQAGSIRESQICSVTIGVIISGAWAGQPGSCLINGPRDLSKLGIRISDQNDTGIQLATTNNQIQFSPRGTTISDAVIIVYRSAPQGAARCLAISNGIGIMRTGTYTQTVDPLNIDVTACNPDT